jgi:hypothetical protein
MSNTITVNPDEQYSLQSLYSVGGPVDEIRAALRIQDIVGQYVKLYRIGASYLGCCPFHAYSEPLSLSVDPVHQVYLCFECKSGGDIFRFLDLIEGDDPLSARRHAAHLAGIDLDWNLGWLEFTEANHQQQCRADKLVRRIVCWLDRWGSESHSRYEELRQSNSFSTKELIARLNLLEREHLLSFSNDSVAVAELYFQKLREDPAEVWRFIDEERLCREDADCLRESEELLAALHHPH